MSQLFCLVLSLVFFAFCPQLVLAQDQGNAEQPLIEAPKSKALQRKWERRAQDMQPYDKNKDGVLDAQEAAKSIDGRFKALDLNKDGQVSKDEAEQAAAKSLQNTLKNEPEASEKILQRGASRQLKKLDNADKDGDGLVSQTEFITYQTERLKKLDKDGDGKLTQGEYKLESEGKKNTTRRRNSDN